MKRHLKQPSVIAEILTGIILGKSLFGKIPGYMDTLFPTPSLEGIELLADFGLVLYLFLVGLEMDLEQLAQTGKTACVIAIAGIVFPFALGVGVAAALRHFILREDPETSQVPFATLAVFTGVGMSLTAFPVLARLLHELKLIATPVGRLALSAAAFNDGVAWLLLAVALAMVDASSPITAVYTLLSLFAWGTFLMLAVRPLLLVTVQMVNQTRSRSWRSALLALVFIAIFLSAWVTSIIGLDAIFGAFMVGVILPRDEALVRVVEKFEDLVVIVFLPLFFALSGLRTDLWTLSSWTSVGMLVLVLVTAVAGKMVGCYAAARGTSIPSQASLAVGILMNTRGLVELIVLNVGLRSRVINESVFSILVLMALTTTFMTAPLIRHWYPKTLWESGATFTEMKRLTATGEGRMRAPSAAGTRGRGSLDGELPSGPLSVLLPSYDARSMVAGLYLLLPAGAHAGAGIGAKNNVLCVNFIDSTSTATVLRERANLLKDPDAREIMMAARLLGAEAESKQVVAPSRDISNQLVEILQQQQPLGGKRNSSITYMASSSSPPPPPIDFALLPWAMDEHYLYEASMLQALPFVDTTFILFSDQGLKLPRFAPGGGPQSTHYQMGIFLCDQQQEQETVAANTVATAIGALVELAVLLAHRRDVTLHLLAYKGTSQATAELLQAHRLPAPTVVADEDGLLRAVAAAGTATNPLDVLLYAFDGGKNNNLVAGNGHVRHPKSHGEEGTAATSGGLFRRGFRLSSSSTLASPQRHQHRRASSSSTTSTTTWPLLQDTLPPTSYQQYGGLTTETGEEAAGGEVWASRALVARMQARLASVHNKRLSLMEVHAGKAQRNEKVVVIGQEEIENPAAAAAAAGAAMTAGRR